MPEDARSAKTTKDFLGVVAVTGLTPQHHLLPPCNNFAHLPVLLFSLSSCSAASTRDDQARIQVSGPLLGSAKEARTKGSQSTDNTDLKLE